MKKLITLTLFILIQHILYAQKKDILDSLAISYGLEHFKKIKNIQFTFNAKKESKTISRQWLWLPKQNIVVKDNKTSFKLYNSESNINEHQFINDLYWLSFPIQLIKDRNSIRYHVENISSYRKLIIQYINNKGNSPNDIYELYLDKNLTIAKWIYRKAGNLKPTLETTWESHRNYEGIKLSLVRNSDSISDNFKVWFENIQIEKQHTK
ncbi:hypothetical protein [Tenacibaculum sp. nBUS_03]|uniref:hypothetical protein n=1 Tax=Tenacibaculum sp. nBUS_03 TaxID=3395320 RepID=UPI003EBAF92C